jgi:hypothetical protein
MKRKRFEEELLSIVDSKYNAAAGGPVQMNPGTPRGSVFDIKVKRLTVAITEDLPYALFGVQYFLMGYTNIVSPPVGVTMLVRGGLMQGVAESAGDYTKVQFVFNDGAGTDIIEVTSGAAAAYPALLFATLSDVFELDNIRVSLSDATITSQFDTSLRIYRKSLFGKTVDNDLSQGSFKAPTQFQSGIIDIPITVGIDKETAILGEILEAGGANFQVTFSITAARSERFNSGLLKQ